MLWVNNRSTVVPSRSFLLIHRGNGCGLKRKPRLNEGSVAVRLNVQVAAKLPQALAHTAKTHAGPTRTQLELLFQSYAFSRVLDLDDDAAVLFTNRYFRSIASGVTMNIGEAFLDETENRDFHLIGAAGETQPESRSRL